VCVGVGGGRGADELVLVLYIGECMVSITNNESRIKEYTHGYQKCNIDIWWVCQDERIVVGIPKIICVETILTVILLG
jgi:hypothetical protein